MENSEKKINWRALTFICFSALWGFGNVLNGFIYFNGLQVIALWIIMFLLYFIPYAFMVGELGSTFKEHGGGVTSWLQQTTTAKIAYYAGWTYWAVHISYIVGKLSGGLKAISWVVFQDAKTYDSINKGIIQIMTLILLILFCWIATRGLGPIKRMATLAGSSMFVMGILFIIMMFAAPEINPNGVYLKNVWSIKNLTPIIDLRFLSNLSILVFAVGGIEKISPYVNKMDGEPSKEFPKSIIFATVMVIVSAIFGTIAMGMMFDASIINANKETFASYAANGAYWAFQKLGEYYGVGNLFMIIYAAANTVGQFAILLISIDAPLRMLLEDENASKFIPRKLLLKNKNGSYVNGIIMMAILAGIIIVAQIADSQIGNASGVIAQLIKLNSVTMPMRYLWVFVAYIALRKNKDSLERDYRFVQNRIIGIFLGVWCFTLTAFTITIGMYSDSVVTMILNISTPVVIVVLGLILPFIRRLEDSKYSKVKKYTGVNA